MLLIALLRWAGLRADPVLVSTRDHLRFDPRDRRLDQFNHVLVRLEMQDELYFLDTTDPAGWFGLLPHRPVGLLFCDPPYKMTGDAAAMTRVAALIGNMAAVAAPNGVLVLRTDSHAQADAVDGWHGPVSQPYGSMAVHFYERDDRDETTQNG